MRISILQSLAYVFAFLAACGGGYLLLVLFSALRWLRSRAKTTASDVDEPVSILKPLRGTDRSMYEAFRSHCLQDSKSFELIFGVSDPQDSAMFEVRRLQAEFPNVPIRLVVCNETLGPNGKVSTLAQMLPYAKHGLILINDSDIRVETDYLRRVRSVFHDPKVGMATALYRAEAGASLASRIEALTIATDFAGGVLCALVVDGGLHFALGSTLAIRREVLEQIGGLIPLAEFLADDYELGARTSGAGFQVALANTVVETHLPSYGFSGMFAHQLRWARTIRDMRKGGYLGLLFTFALPWALLCTLFALAAPWSLTLLGIIFALRIASAGVLSGPVLYDRPSQNRLWLVPFRDFVGLAVWIWSFAGDTVVWRGERFHVKDGKLIPR